jgi:hypothetical protein
MNLPEFFPRLSGAKGGMAYIVEAVNMPEARINNPI